MRKHLLWTLAAAVLVSFAGWASPEVGMIVVYQVDADKPASGAKPTIVEMRRRTQTLIGALDRRLNPGGRALGHCREFDDAQIEVIIFRAAPDVMQRIADLLPRPGTLEFRVLANNRDHKAQIALAKQTEADDVRDARGELVARWVPVPKGRENVFANYPEISKQVGDLGGKETMEILLVQDPFNVTGEYLTHCSPGVDREGRPCIHLTFNTRGAQLFGGLTGANLPDKTQDFTRKLGIILDGYLYSAPAIQSPIHDRCEITGSFTEQEVKDLVDIFNAGSLPAAIRKVEQRVVAP
jgi:SecD/SecF fusion protein